MSGPDGKPGDDTRRGFNPVAWLVLLLPAAAIVGGIWTIWLAAGPGATDASPDEVRRMAQVQEAAMDADEVAAREGLSARLHLLDDGLRLELLPMPGTMAPQLQLVHPVEARHDRLLGFSPGPDGWRSEETIAGDIAWRLRLVAPDGRWRLVGRYRPGDRVVELLPALPATQAPEPAPEQP